MNDIPNMAAFIPNVAAPAPAPPAGADTAYYTAMCLAMSNMVSSSFKAAIELQIPDILAKAEGGRPMSAREILTKLPTKTTPGPKAVFDVNRIMRILVQQGVFTETLDEEQEAKYGLTDVSRLCVSDSPDSVVPFHHLAFSDECVKAYDRLHEVILDERKSPFEAAWGERVFEYVPKHPEYGALFQTAMTNITRPELPDILERLRQNDWLEGVKTFVDVGGGKGNIVGGVVSQYPHIRGINFDLPKVVEGAPQVNGVRHVGGDFYNAVPSGDVIFMKYILHNNSDKNCMKILTACFEALPQDGKVIVSEYILNYDPSPTVKTKFTITLDILMMGMYNGARERTVDEYRQLLSAAGFSKFSVCQYPEGIDLMLAMK